MGSYRAFSLRAHIPRLLGEDCSSLGEALYTADSTWHGLRALGQQLKVCGQMCPRQSSLCFDCDVLMQRFSCAPGWGREGAEGAYEWHFRVRVKRPLQVAMKLKAKDQDLGKRPTQWVLTSCSRAKDQTNVIGHLSIHSFNKHLVIIYCVLYSALGTGGIAVHKTS